MGNIDVFWYADQAIGKDPPISWPGAASRLFLQEIVDGEAILYDAILIYFFGFAFHESGPAAAVFPASALLAVGGQQKNIDGMMSIGYEPFRVGVSLESSGKRGGIEVTVDHHQSGCSLKPGRFRARIGKELISSET